MSFIHISRRLRNLQNLLIFLLYMYLNKNDLIKHILAI